MQVNGYIALKIVFEFEGIVKMINVWYLVVETPYLYNIIIRECSFTIFEASTPIVYLWRPGNTVKMLS